MKYKDLHYEIRVGAGLVVQTLQGEFKQVLLNLLGNAVDASAATGGRIIVSARLAHSLGPEPVLVMSVADTGSGISKKDRPKIFEPFFTTKKDVGTGLGLWITRDLIEKRGGHIRVRTRTSRPSGTVMTVFIPVASRHAHESAA
jgi:signal transduction histidine kinase